MSDLSELRGKAQELVQRLQNDPAFRQQLEDNPIDVLLEAGLPERAIPDFLRETNIPADVVGYDYSDGVICLGTCLATLPDRGLPG